MLLSICIPSYNRGERARELVNDLLKLPYGSTKYADAYSEISKIDDNRLCYHQFEENVGFMKNLNQVIRMSRGQYCLIISDEDCIDESQLGKVLDILRSLVGVSFIKTKTSLFYADSEYLYAGKGHEALETFYMAGNYVSGIIYNRSILTDEIINRYEEVYMDNQGYLNYPHMFYDAYMALHGDFIQSDVLLIIEGKSEDDLQNNITEKQAINYNNYDNRIAQMNGFLDQVMDLDAGAGDKFYMFCKVCNKYLYMILLVHDSIRDNDESFLSALDRIRQELKRWIRILQLPLTREEIESVDEYVDDEAAKIEQYAYSYMGHIN